MADACHHCGQDIAARAEWNGLVVTATGDVYWRGIKAPRPRPSGAKMLYVLCQRGEASHGTLEMTGSENFDRSVLKVQMSHLRTWMVEQGIGVRIVSRFGWGYALEMAE